MKRSCLIFPLILVLFAFTGCKKSVVFEEKVIFPNSNWAFENKAITFKAPLTGSKNPFKIIIELELNGTPNVDMIHAVFTIITPKGGKTMKSTVFNFLSPREDYIVKKSPNEKIYRLTLYPKKYFSETGEYTFEINQLSHKADNYGIHALTLRIEKTKE